MSTLSNNTITDDDQYIQFLNKSENNILRWDLIEKMELEKEKTGTNQFDYMISKLDKKPKEDE